MALDARRLAILRSVAETGSFAAAAAQLRHTPSAVSQQIAALERSAGTQLVRRHPRGARLTEAGRVLNATADAIQAELTAAERSLAELTAQAIGTLTVATFLSAGEPVLAPALSEANRSHDLGAEVIVVEAEPDRALAAVRSGEADLALVYHFHTPDPPESWGLGRTAKRYVPLMRDDLYVVLGMDHRFAGRQRLRLSELAPDPWIHGWDQPGEALDTLASTHGFSPRVVCRVSDYGFAQALVGAGVGVTLVPRLGLANRPDVRAVALDPPARRYVGAVLPPRRLRRPEQLLIDLLKQGAAAWGKASRPSREGN